MAKLTFHKGDLILMTVENNIQQIASLLQKANGKKQEEKNVRLITKTIPNEIKLKYIKRKREQKQD